VTQNQRKIFSPRSTPAITEASFLGYEFKIVLASTSPRRIKLLKELGVDFIVAEPVAEESSTHSDPKIRVIQNAEAKVLSVSSRFPDAVIIGADTIAYLDGAFLGKPENIDDAVHMLESLSGKTHHVYTGVVVLDTASGEKASGFEDTRIKFVEMSKTTIEQYVASGEPMDKAGAYAIQGSGKAFVEELEGSWSNVVGLPLELLKELLNKIRAESS
jgi:septum formation protein